MAGQGTSRADYPLVEQASRLNVAHSVAALTERSKVISDLGSKGKLKIFRERYILHMGEVEFLDLYLVQIKCDHVVVSPGF